ncbi:MAG: tyrosine-type recombinase/integrase [Succiniclasticum sp.]|nr:tyrosine-type recombinase/integrase [Succiniclasticum sp.]
MATNRKYFISAERDGYPLDISYVNRLLRSLHHQKHLTTHIFRHTHISLLAEEGVPLKAIMVRVGHNEPRTTMAVYTHVSDKMQQEVMNALNTISI